MRGAASAWHQELARQARSSRNRAERLQQMIRSVGSEPYRSFGIGAPFAWVGGWLVGSVSTRLQVTIARRLANHAWAEYESLAAFIEDAEGIPEDLPDAVLQLRSEVAREAEILGKEVAASI